MDKVQFNDALVSLVEYAAANANHVSKKDVKIYFQDIITDEKMYDAIYSYLKESKIDIDDVDSDSINPLPKSHTDNNADEEESFSVKDVKESEEELAFLELYKKDMENISPLSNGEKVALIDRLKQKDSMAMAKLTENYLYLVHDIAMDYKGKGITLGDLIQEGNVGLMLGLSEFNGKPEDFDSFIDSKIRESIDDAISMQINSERISSHLAGRMNKLDDVSRDLTEKLGHAPSIKELSKEMNITEDEVDTIIRTSLNVLSVNGPDEEEQEAAAKAHVENQIKELDL